MKKENITGFIRCNRNGMKNNSFTSLWVYIIITVSRSVRKQTMCKILILIKKSNNMIGSELYISQNIKTAIGYVE